MSLGTVLIVVAIVVGILLFVGLFRLRSRRRRRVLTHDQEARQAFFRSVSEKDRGES